MKSFFFLLNKLFTLSLMIKPKSFYFHFYSWMFYLLKLVGYHGEGLENRIRWPSDGDYPLRAVPLWDVDAGTTL